MSFVSGVTPAHSCKNKLLKESRMKLFSRSKTVLRLPEVIGDNWHENFIIHIAFIIRPKVYVELGLYQCALFNRIIPFADKLIGLDCLKNPGKCMKKSPKVEFVCSTTSDFAKVAKNKGLKIDMLFIDADHSKESVYKDFKAFFPLMNDQGLILLHDGYPKNEEYTQSGYCGDGYKAIEELTDKAKGYEMMTIPLHPGLTLCRKRSKHLHWK